jgi:hypothetical protein
MLEVLNQDYIRTARAKGVSDPPVVWKHALKNAAIPIVTIVGIELGTLLGGSVITETIFAWPGVGRLSVQAIANRDYPVSRRRCSCWPRPRRRELVGRRRLHGDPDGCDDPAEPTEPAPPRARARPGCAAMTTTMVLSDEAARSEWWRSCAAWPGAALVGLVVVGRRADRTRGAATVAIRPDRAGSRRPAPKAPGFRPAGRVHPPAPITSTRPLARVIYGARPALLVGFAAVSSRAAGMAIGLVPATSAAAWTTSSCGWPTCSSPFRSSCSPSR